MARMTPQLLEGETLQLPDDEINELGNDLDSRLKHVASEFSTSDNINMKIYRVVPGQGQGAYCFSCTDSELPILDILRDDYGGGTFEVKVLVNNLLKRRVKEIVSPPVRRKNQDMETTSLVGVMMQGFDRMNNNILKLLENKQSSAATPIVNDPVAMVTAMAGIVKSLMPQQLQVAPAPATDVAGLVSVLKLGVDLAKETAGGGGGGSGYSLLEEAMRQFGPILTKAAMDRQNQTSPTPAPVVNGASVSPMLASPAGAPTREAPPMPQPNPQIVALKNQLGMLCHMAAINGDPVTYADMIIDSVDDQTLDEWLGDPDLLQKLGKIEPRVLSYLPWFTAVLNEVSAALTQDNQNGDHAENLAQGSGNSGVPIGT